MKKYALIMAGGEGHRAGTDIPKQFVKLLGIPMLWWSVRAFYQEDPTTRILVVMHPGFFDDWDILYREMPDEAKQGIEVTLVAGGRSRGESVSNGLMEVPAEASNLVAVHDAARPLVSVEMIREGWRCAAEHGAAVPVVPVTDSLREKTAEGSVAVDRSRYMAVQTPQVADAVLLHKAYQQPERPEFTDDASRIQALGVEPALYAGNPHNIKVTNPADFIIAEAIMGIHNS